MKYEIGQKVETPLGVGVVKYNMGGSILWVSFDENRPEIEINKEDIKPYRTAHDKLLSMGLSLKIINDAWGSSVFSHEWWSDDNRRIIAFYMLDKLVTVYEANHEIMRIIPQYLEEIVE